jgi:methyl-accepting chemotaxis protein
LKIIITKIQSLQQSSMDTETTFKEIRNGVTQIMDMFYEVSNVLTELATGSSDILTVLSSLNNITSEVDNGSKEMQKGAIKNENTLLKKGCSYC